MAKESSFDIVSTVDMQEIDNAFQQAKKELAQRYDLKDSGAEITLDKAGKSMTVAAPADFVAKQVIDVIGSKLVASKINKDIKAEKFKVKVQIEGDKLRVSSPSRDALQEVIAFLKGKDYGQPLQYVNYR